MIFERKIDDTYYTMTIDYCLKHTMLVNTYASQKYRDHVLY